MAKPKKVDPLKQREKRAKIAAAGGVVLLIIVAAIEIPPVLHSGPPPGSTSSSLPLTTTVSIAPTGAPSTGTSTPSTGAAPSTSGELADTDVPPTTATGQLVSFSVFQAKNPFAPQVPTHPASIPDTSGTTTTPTGTTPDTSGGTTTPSTPTAPTGTTSVIPSTSPPGTGTTTTPTTTTPATAPTVEITVNGKASHVAALGTFPTGAPVFRLASFTSTTASVGIVGGSYAQGSATLTLELGKPVTLENQTDGKRYTLELVKTR